MLGKGLESLIPPKSQNDAGRGQAGNPQADLAGDPALANPSTSDPPVNEPAIAKPFLIHNFLDDAGAPASSGNIADQTREPASSEGVKAQPVVREPEIAEGEVPLALKPDFEIVRTEKEPAKKTEAVFQIEVDKITPNPHQPRRSFDEESLKELAASIREFGIIQPLILSKILKEKETGTEVEYQLIAGERRLLAAKMAGLRTVPAIVKTVSFEREKLEMAVIENLQRTDLNSIETARAYAKLQDEFGLTQREIASRLGKSRETVANTLRLLNLPSEIQASLEQGKINESQARLLLQIGDIGRQREIFLSLLKQGGTVRELREKIKGKEIKPRTVNPELEEIKSRLEEALGTKVNIRRDGEKGRVVIDFYSLEELAGLAEKLTGQRKDQSL
jgi:ParB family chromosome partitioning protein